MFQGPFGACTGPLALFSAIRSSWRGFKQGRAGVLGRNIGEVMTELLGPTPSRPTPPIFFLCPASTRLYTGTLALSSATRSSKSARTSASKACVYLPSCTQKLVHSHLLQFRPISLSPYPHPTCLQRARKQDILDMTSPQKDERSEGTIPGVILSQARRKRRQTYPELGLARSWWFAGLRLAKSGHLDAADFVR